MNVDVDVRGVGEIKAKLEKVDDHYRPLFGELAEIGERAAEDKSKPHPQDLGSLSKGNNIRSELAPAGTPLSSRVYTRSPIVIAVDQGREAGKGKMPPIRAMARFATRHGIPLKDGKRNVPFYLARAIQRRGSKGVKFFEAAARVIEEKAPAKVAKVAKDIERDWGK